ncbi:MAG: urease accessory protein [Gammaproteobacteria bacterium]|nr:urease accessory protein [Gammaproteobacteria bacterium]
MTSLFMIGFLIGMRHALEADHVAAVSALATNQNSIRQTLKSGAVWGLGHTITLFLIGSAVIWIDAAIPATIAHSLEFLVGIMLVLLGADVLRRVIKDKIHFHRHKHHGETEHFHAHSHAKQKAHTNEGHQHQHKEGFPLRFLFVGLMHGMAGSAALILLTLNTVQTPWEAMLYMLLFGIGSILGMALLSVAIVIPLRSSAKGLTWLNNGLQTTIGIFTVGLGLNIMYSMA